MTTKKVEFCISRRSQLSQFSQQSYYCCIQWKH